MRIVITSNSKRASILFVDGLITYNGERDVKLDVWQYMYTQHSHKVIN